jgi:hypothetical protein
MREHAKANPKATAQSLASSFVAGHTKAALLNEPYRISDGVERKAADMTIREWETRKRLLEGQQEGISRSIEICDRAIEAIKSAGVKTLGEV